MGTFQTIAGLTSLLLGFISLSACGTLADERTYTADGDFSSVKIRLTNGDLSVVTGVSDEVEIDVDFSGFANADDVSRYVKDDQLVVNYSCPLCGGDLWVEVPEGMPIEAELANGDIYLADLSGKLNANVQNGGIEGLHLSGDAHLSARAGTVTLEYEERPDFVLAETTVGVIDVYVPTGGYDLEFGGNAGVVHLTDVFVDETAESQLKLFTETGEINVTGRSLSPLDEPAPQ